MKLPFNARTEYHLQIIMHVKSLDTGWWIDESI